MVVVSFSFVLRWLQRKWPLHAKGTFRDVLVFALTIVLATVILGVSLEIYVRLAARGVPQAWLLGGTLAAAFLVMLPWFVRARGNERPAAIFLATVLLHHLYNGALLVYSGLWLEEPALGVVWATATTLALIGYGWPYARLGLPARSAV
jgi:hypothetical protein